jgi:RHS repeat-associated protein
MTIFVYDALGRMAAEYSTAVDTPSCVTCYLSPDHLGTPRLITDQSGIVVARHDYLPFGEEIPANTVGRNSQWGPGNDSINQKLTGKERDSESGLDYFGARYYGSGVGRFTSPDPKTFYMRTLGNPQKWNKYAYVLNNPLALFDPDGREEITVTYRTFIPDQQISFLGQRYDGNNRTFMTSTSANDVFRSKSVATVTVETDPKISSNPLISHQEFGGFAVTRDASGKVIGAE